MDIYPGLRDSNWCCIYQLGRAKKRGSFEGGRIIQYYQMQESLVKIRTENLSKSREGVGITMVGGVGGQGWGEEWMKETWVNGY